VHYSGRVSSTQPPLERPDEVRAKAREFEQNLSAPWPVAQPAPEGAHAGSKGRRLKLKNPGRSPLGLVMLAELERDLHGRGIEARLVVADAASGDDRLGLSQGSPARVGVAGGEREHAEDPRTMKRQRRRPRGGERPLPWGRGGSTRHACFTSGMQRSPKGGGPAARQRFRVGVSTTSIRVLGA
jgi:hypothetical protein